MILIIIRLTLTILDRKIPMNLHENVHHEAAFLDERRTLSVENGIAIAGNSEARSLFDIRSKSFLFELFSCRKFCLHYRIVCQFRKLSELATILNQLKLALFTIIVLVAPLDQELEQLLVRASQPFGDTDAWHDADYLRALFPRTKVKTELLEFTPRLDTLLLLFFLLLELWLLQAFVGQRRAIVDSTASIEDNSIEANHLGVRLFDE